MAEVFSAGSLLVKERLPEAVRSSYDPSRILDKSGVKSLVSDIISSKDPNAHNALADISGLFFHKATEHGYSTPLSDYENNSDERTALLAEFSSKVNRVVESKKSKEAKSKELSDLLADYGKKAEKTNINQMVKQRSTAGRMALTGARGNPSQLMQATFSPMMARDIDGQVIPVPIKRSFAEGLSMAESLAMSYEGRSNIVKTQTSTSEPGYMFKAIAPNMYHEVVTIQDCGTKNGVMVEVDNKKDVLWRVPAGSDKPIEPQDYKRIKASGTKTIKLRNVRTCEATEGVCQLCYGIDSRGGLPPIGENVGVIGAQSMSEVLTQAVLSTKHGSNTGKTRSPFEDAKNLLNMTKNFKDEATISTIAGSITGIEKTPFGDTNVLVNGIPHFVPREQSVIVKKGQNVDPGDSLSTGTVNPVTFTNLRGIGEGRSYYAKALKDAYDNPGLDTRHFDLIARNLIKYVKVEDPGESSFLPGDVIDVAKAAPVLQSDMVEVPVREAIGKKLALQVLDIVPGTIITKSSADALMRNGISRVSVSKSGLAFTPMVKGIDFAKSMDPNWLSRIAFNRIPEHIATAAALGQKAEIHSTDPIASYVIGSDFGKGKNGRY